MSKKLGTLTVTIDLDDIVKNKTIPLTRIPSIMEGIAEVKLIEKGLKPSRTAREFLEELRDENPESN